MHHQVWVGAVTMGQDLIEERRQSFYHESALCMVINLILGKNLLKALVIVQTSRQTKLKASMR